MYYTRSISIYDRSFPFAGLDFMVDKNGKLVFLEANSIPAGAGITYYVSNLIQEKFIGKVMDLEDPNMDVLDILKLLLFKLLEWDTDSTILFTRPKNVIKRFLEFDRFIISKYLRFYGFDVREKTLSELHIRDGVVYFRDGSSVIAPDLIFRRVFGFPKKVRQYVFNPSEAGGITQNKFKVHEIIRNVARYSNDFYQPIYFKVNNRAQLIEALEDIFSMGKDAVIKPLNGYGGKEVKIIRNGSFVKRLAERFKSYPLLVQEKIDTMPIESGDGSKYYFDIRSIVFGGKFAGFQLRRSSKPIDSYGNDKYITNVSAGGSYVHAFVGEVDIMGSRNLGFKVLKIIDSSLNLDGNVAVFDYKFFKRLERASILITRTLAREISERLKGA